MRGKVFDSPSIPDMVSSVGRWLIRSLRNGWHVSVHPLSMISSSLLDRADGVRLSRAALVAALVPAFSTALALGRSTSPGCQVTRRYRTYRHTEVLSTVLTPNALPSGVGW